MKSAPLRWDTTSSFNDRRLEIMRSLRDVFKRGPATATMQDVADRLGMTKGNLYHYFSSKQELEYACHLKGMEESLQLLQIAGASDGSPTHRLTALIRGLVHKVVEDPYGSVMVVELKNLSPAQRRHYLALRDRFDQGIRSLIDEGVSRNEFEVEDVRLAGFAILGAINGVARWFKSSGALSADQVADRFATLLVKSVGCPRS